MVNLRSGNGISIPGASSNENDVKNRGGLKGNNRLPKIDFPHYGGEGPRELLRKARKYFKLHQIPNELKVGVAEMHLKGKANIWFDEFIANHPGVDWNLFSKEICKDYRRRSTEVFSKIKRLGSIDEYD